MDANKQKEQFNIAYVGAIAAKVGLNSNPPVVDDDSVDVSLTGRGYAGKVRNPQIQLQLKCTSKNAASISGGVLKFPLKKKNYDDLRGENVLCPRYLVVMVVPDDISDWAEHHDEHMLLRHSCYWVSIRTHPDSLNTTTVTVEVPLSQKLTTDNLALLMQAASDGKSL